MSQYLREINNVNTNKTMSKKMLNKNKTSKTGNYNSTNLFHSAKVFMAGFVHVYLLPENSESRPTQNIPPNLIN